MPANPYLPYVLVVEDVSVLRSGDNVDSIVESVLSTFARVLGTKLRWAASRASTEALC